MKETVEDVTHTFSSWDDKGPFILKNKDFKNTIAIKQKVVLNGTIQGSRAYVCNFNLGTIVRGDSSSFSRIFEFKGQSNSPTTFNNSSYECLVPVSACTIIGNNLSYTSSVFFGLAGPGISKNADDAFPQMRIKTNNELVTDSTGISLKAGQSSTDILNITVHYIMERYYINF